MLTALIASGAASRRGACSSPDGLSIIVSKGKIGALDGKRQVKIVSFKKVMVYEAKARKRRHAAVVRGNLPAKCLVGKSIKAFH